MATAVLDLAETMTQGGETTREGLVQLMTEAARKLDQRRMRDQMRGEQEDKEGVAKRLKVVHTMHAQ